MRNVLKRLKKVCVNFIISSAYASAIFIATGAPQIAMATSCDDVVPGTAIKYSSALSMFVYDGAKTYAIAKSAITGSQDLPDAFFAFSSWIGKEYEITGTDDSSLKFKVGSGYFGAARPVQITSKAIEAFILSQYGQYLDSASSNKSTYISAWKEYGAGVGFTDLDGSVLAYTNWPGGVTPKTTTITWPQAVVMGSDGVWRNGENGQRISQIVEFNEKLDCATDLTGPPTEPGQTGSTIIAGRVCGRDINGDEDISEEEIKQCETNAAGQEYCPLESVDCTASYAAAQCLKGTLNTTTNLCESEPTVTETSTANTYTCSTGTTLNSTTLKCESSPTCSTGTYDTSTGSCIVGNNTCPLGAQYSCKDVSGKMKCSSNECFDASAPTGGEEEVEMDESMYQDDARNADGSCTGQLMIFAGKGSRCRPPGMKVGYINNCCKSDQVMTEDTGNKITSAISTIKTVYEMARVCYYTYQLASSAASVTAVTSTTLTVGTTTLTGSVASSVAAGAATAATGASLGASLMASMQAYLSAMFTGPQIIIAVVVYIVLKVLMGSGCDATDIQTGSQNEAGQCHYIGTYCQKKWFIGCVQKAKRFCCFNSMMARIIHEQGRPQLTTFGPDGAWGTEKNPNCRGFTPEEFESLDFSKIDFSEYFSVLQKDMATKINNAQNKIETTIQNRKDQIQ